MGRPRKYDWDDKRDVCWKLWNDDKLSAGEIVKWFANHFQLPESELPGPNQFHHKFREWGFPPRRKKRTEEDDAQLLARMRGLFAQNLPAMEIQKILLAEGWDMDNYQFRTFRRKHGMLMRNQHGYKPLPEKRKRPNQDDEEDENLELVDGVEGTEETDELQRPPLPPEEIARREQRLAEIQVQSDEALRTRKRRRRIRGYGHLPADEPNLAPRYGSETSLDECKAYLNLNNETYLQIRSEYQTICREMGIMKMTECVDGEWQASKDKLIRENAHLSAMLHPLQPDLAMRGNALNCICSDVTKRMRNEAKSMSIADANNILGMDPSQSKHVRRVFYEILENDHFTTAVACGREHLLELREQWLERCENLREAANTGDPQKVRAVDILSRDARKRYGDDMTRKDPSKKQWQKQNHSGPGPGPAQGVAASKKKTPKVINHAAAMQTAGTLATLEQDLNSDPATRLNPQHPGVLLGPGWFGRADQVPNFAPGSNEADTQNTLNFDLDPLLSETTHGAPWPPQASAPTPLSEAVPAYFRLAPDSQITGSHPRMWLGKLTPTGTFEALQRAATSKAGAARVAKVSGIVKNDDGSEDSWVIENDEELGVYLQEAGEKATFVVVLEGGYA